MNSRQIIKLFEQNKWKLIRITRGHYIYRKNNKTVSVPFHTKELSKGLEKVLLKILREEA